MSGTVRDPGVTDVAMQDLSWRSPEDGWALAAKDGCTTGSCARLLRTTDGGQRWESVAIPPARLTDGPYACQKYPCVSGVSFANARVGYLYEPGLLMTNDGGRSWRRDPGPQVETLSIFGETAFRVSYRHTGCPGPCQPSLQEAAAGSTRWRTLVDRLATPDRSGSAQIVGSGRTLLLALYGSQAGPVPAYASVYRSGDAGTSWRTQNDPCSGNGPDPKQEEDLVALAAAPAGFFAGLCTPHTGADTGAFVIVSTDAGAYWKRSGRLPAVHYPALIAAGSPATIAVSTGRTGGSGTFTARLLISKDGGHNWRPAVTDPQHLSQAGAPAWLGFQSSTVGRWVADPSGVWTTTNGGARWTRTTLR